MDIDFLYVLHLIGGPGGGGDGVAQNAIVSAILVAAALGMGINYTIRLAKEVAKFFGRGK